MMSIKLLNFPKVFTVNYLFIQAINLNTCREDAEDFQTETLAWKTGFTLWGCTIQVIYTIQIAHSYTECMCHQDRP